MLVAYIIKWISLSIYCHISRIFQLFTRYCSI